MAKYGSDDAKVEFDDSGGTLQDISAEVLAIGGISKEAALVPSRGFGQAWAAFLATGAKSMAAFTIEMFYDDTAGTGSANILDDIGATRTCKVTYGGSKSTSVEVIIQKFDRSLQDGQLHKCVATVQPTGEVTEA